MHAYGKGNETVLFLPGTEQGMVVLATGLGRGPRISGVSGACRGNARFAGGGPDVGNPATDL